MPAPDPQLTRRVLVRSGLGLLLAGCAAPARLARDLPSPPWSRGGPRSQPDPIAPAPAPVVAVAAAGPIPGAIPRSRWARGAPIVSRLNPMRPVRTVTIHHDALYNESDADAATAAILERHRRDHLQRSPEPYGDIGYHFVVDRKGQVWEGRSLAYQGAHVKDHNEGNVGIMLLGNFEQQRPTEAQLRGLQNAVSTLLRHYRVSPRDLRTHREWGSATLCPGANLQRQVVVARSAGRYA